MDICISAVAAWNAELHTAILSTHNTIRGQQCFSRVETAIDRTDTFNISFLWFFAVFLVIRQGICSISFEEVSWTEMLF